MHPDRRPLLNLQPPRPRNSPNPTPLGLGNDSQRPATGRNTRQKGADVASRTSPPVALVMSHCPICTANTRSSGGMVRVHDTYHGKPVGHSTSLSPFPRGGRGAGGRAGPDGLCVSPPRPSPFPPPETEREQEPSTARVMRKTHFRGPPSAADSPRCSQPVLRPHAFALARLRCEVACGGEHRRIEFSGRYRHLSARECVHGSPMPAV